MSRRLSPAERGKIALNVNLDSVAGSPNLAALTSGYRGVEPFVLGVAEANGLDVRTVRPLMTNSDHANFAQAGIPRSAWSRASTIPPPICVSCSRPPTRATRWARANCAPPRFSPPPWLLPPAMPIPRKSRSGDRSHWTEGLQARS